MRRCSADQMPRRRFLPSGAPGASSTRRPARQSDVAARPTAIHVNTVHSVRARWFPNRRDGATGQSLWIKTLDPSSHYTSRASGPLRRLLAQPIDRVVKARRLGAARAGASERRASSPASSRHLPGRSTTRRSNRGALEEGIAGDGRIAAEDDRAHAIPTQSHRP